MATARKSVRGSSGASARASRYARGFTLIEMLVVMVIIGIVVSVVALAPSRNRTTDLAEEAQRLAALLDSAADQAQVRSMPIAWQPVDGGYVFSESTANGGWRVLDDTLLKPYSWRAGITGVAIHYAGSSETLRRLVFGNESIAAPVVIVLNAGGTHWDVVGNGIGHFEARRP
jgi:general secretion pathway protein H